MSKITVLFLGSTGAGPVYSLEMVKAIVTLKKYDIQVIVSEGLLNRTIWEKELGESVQLEVVKTYRHTPIGVLFSFFKIWRPLRVVNLIRSFKPDFLYLPFGLVWSPVIFPLLPREIKIVYTLHDPHPHDVPTNFVSFLYDNIERRIRKKYSSGIVILNNNDKEYVQKNICPNVIVIPHASFGYYSGERDAINNEICKNTIGFIGRIEPYKGLDVLLEAYRLIKHKGIKLLIAGNGSIQDDLLAQIKSDKGIILINRYIEDEEFSTILDKVDFVVLPYKRASQSGVIPMAFAYGKAVIATNVGALSEQVPDGTGLIVNPTAKEIAYSIEELYQNDNYVLYGKNAKEYANKYLSWEYSANSLVKFFNNIQ